MIKFFLHKKFWLPFVIIFVMIVVIELLLRTGIYDNYLKPNSHMGSSFERMKSLKEFGLDEINWITTGDSRMDWGVNHKKVRRYQKQRGVNHVRMSFGGADFMVIQSVINWSIKHMNSLDGVVLGVSENKLTHDSTYTKLYPIAWPFKSALNFERDSVMPDKMKKWRYFYGLAIVNYFKDIKDFISNPLKRFKQLEEAQQKELIQILDYKSNRTGNLCAYKLDSLSSCVKTANQLKKQQKIPAGLGLTLKLCGSTKAQVKLKSKNSTAPIKHKQRIIKGWQSLIKDVLNENKYMLFVLLPDYQMYDYLLKPVNAEQITQQIITPFKNHPKFILLDLRQFVPIEDQCQFYSDPLHFNNKGSHLLTKKILDTL